jgi:tetratricopeptide (TPR) repeat protein
MTVLGLLPFFGGVSALVRGARTRRQHIAVDWAARGDRDLKAGRADRAAEEYRSAQEYAREKDAYRLELAEALIASRHTDQARGQLLALWAENPADAFVNLELGRIAAGQGDTSEAMRFYHAAIDGAWRQDALVSRRNARIELARYLIGKGDRTKAQAELIALVDELPPDAPVMTDTAAMLLESGSPQRAEAVLTKVLTLSPRDGRALQLAGEAAFSLADYHSAARYFDQAAGAGALDADHQRMRNLSTRVLTVDPFARGISSRARVRRVIEAFHIAQQSLDRCPADALPDLRARVAAAEPKTTERVLAQDPDAVDETISLLTDIEGATIACGPGGNDDAALRLVLKQRRAS